MSDGTLRSGVQFAGTLGPGASDRWRTDGWDPARQVLWSVVPTAPGAQVDWDVAVHRATEDSCSYWITVRNRSGEAVDFEGRYAVASEEGAP